MGGEQKMHAPFYPSQCFSIRDPFPFNSFGNSVPSDIASYIFTSLVSIIFKVSDLA